MLKSLALTSCAVTPPDVPICVEFTIERGRCVHIISGKTFDVDETRKYKDKTWWDLRPTMVQVPSSSWAEIKSFIIKVCKKTNQCDEKITSWKKTSSKIDETINKKLD